MKIAIVYPVFEWASRYVAESVEKSFKKIGWDVLSLDPVSLAPFYADLMEKRGYKDIIINKKLIYDLVFEKIAFKILEEEVKFALFIHGGYVSERFVNILRKYNVNTAVWLLDDPHEIDFSKRYSYFYDYVFTVEKESVEIHKRKVKDVFYLPLGYDEDIFSPKDVDEKYKSDICVLGSGFKERIELLEKIYPYIKNRKLKLVGKWDNLSSQSPLLNHVVEGVVRPEVASLYYSGAKIVINQHRDETGSLIGTNINEVKGISPNPRLFECIACGSFCIIDDKRKGAFDFFKKTAEIDSFSSDLELTEKINFWLDNETLRKKAAKNANLKNKTNSMTERIMEMEKLWLKKTSLITI
jgi:spore maturation protein CgeB